MKRSSTVTFGNRFLRNLMIFCNLTAGLSFDRISGRSKPLPYRESVASHAFGTWPIRIVDLISVSVASISARNNALFFCFCARLLLPPLRGPPPARREAF